MPQSDRLSASPFIALVLSAALAGAAAAQPTPPAAGPSSAFVQHVEAGRDDLRNQGNYSRAAAEFAAAIEIDPARGEAWWGAGVAARRLGDPSAAVLFLTVALARGAGPEADLALAEACEELKRPVAAWRAATRARERFTAANDEKQAAAAGDAAGRLAAANPDLEGRAAALVQDAGPVAEILARYVGFAALEGNRRAGASIDAGKPVDARRLVWLGLSKDGLPARFAAALKVSPGLSLSATEPLQLTAAERASAEETVTIEDPATSTRTQLSFRVLGPAAHLELKANTSQAPPGRRIHFAARATDTAANRLWTARLAWTVARAEGAGAVPAGALKRAESLGQPGIFEPHRNILALPADAPDTQLGAYVVRVATPDGAAAAECSVRFARDAEAPAVARAPGIDWRDSFEEALDEARAAGRPLLAEFTAEW